MATANLLFALASLPFAAGIVALVLLAPRLGHLRASGWLLTFAAFLLASEDGFLSIWLALAPPDVDPHGVAGVANAHARGHMFGAGVWTLALAALLGVLAWGPLQRREPWAWRALAAVFALAAVVTVVELVFFYAHGLDVPGAPATTGGFGWPGFALLLASAGAGLWLARRGP